MPKLRRKKKMKENYKKIYKNEIFILKNWLIIKYMEYKKNI